MPIISTDILKRIYESELPSYSLRSQFLLVGIYEGLARVGGQFNVNDEEYIAISYSKDKEEAQALFKHLSEEGYIKYLTLDGSAELTTTGYREIETLQKEFGQSDWEKHLTVSEAGGEPTAGAAPRVGTVQFDPNQRSEFVGPNVFIRPGPRETDPPETLPGILTASEFLRQHNYPATQALSDLFSIARIYARHRSPDGNQLSSSTLLFAMIDGWHEDLRSPLDSEIAVLKLLRDEIRVAHDLDVSMISDELFDCKNFKTETANTIPEFQDADRFQFDLIDFSDVVHTRLRTH